VGSYASTPDSAVVSVTGDLDVRIKVALDDWTPASLNYEGLISSDGLSYPVNLGFYFRINHTTGYPEFAFSEDGTTVKTRTATAAPVVADGAAVYLRVTLDVDNGAAGHDTKFYTSADGVAWTQLGATVTAAGVTSIFDSPRPVAVGHIHGGAHPAVGKIYYAELRDGIEGPAVAVFDPDTDAMYNSPAFVSSATGELWTVVGSAAIRTV